MNYFDEYVNRYDISIFEISYKYLHSYRVMNNMNVLAKNLSLPKADIELAKCIGLLHDIGRFYQFTTYHSFSDKNIDHGDYGEKILREENALKYFDISPKDYEVVYAAIRNHNKYQIEDNLSQRSLMFARMIRDTDKLDIIYSLTEPNYRLAIREDGSSISNEIKEEFYNNINVRYTKCKNLNDNLVAVFSFAFDIYYNIILGIIKKEKYYEKLYNRIEHKDIFNPYIKYIQDYIDDRIE